MSLFVSETILFETCTFSREEISTLELLQKEALYLFNNVLVEQPAAKVQHFQQYLHQTDGNK